MTKYYVFRIKVLVGCWATEQSRAVKESADAERKARESAEATRRNLGAQLETSLHALRKPPVPVSSSPVAEETKGTGTYGPSPRPARSQRPVIGLIPYNVAFREVVSFVTSELNASGEQWSEQSRQDLVSTVLISATKQGLLGVWERETES